MSVEPERRVQQPEPEGGKEISGSFSSGADSEVADFQRATSGVPPRIRIRELVNRVTERDHASGEPRYTLISVDRVQYSAAVHRAKPGATERALGSILAGRERVVLAGRASSQGYFTALEFSMPRTEIAASKMVRLTYGRGRKLRTREIFSDTALHDDGSPKCVLRSEFRKGKRTIHTTELSAAELLKEIETQPGYQQRPRAVSLVLDGERKELRLMANNSSPVDKLLFSKLHAGEFVFDFRTRSRRKPGVWVLGPQHALPQDLPLDRAVGTLEVRAHQVLRERIYAVSNEYETMLPKVLVERDFVSGRKISDLAAWELTRELEKLPQYAQRKVTARVSLNGRVFETRLPGRKGTVLDMALKERIAAVANVTIERHLDSYGRLRAFGLTWEGGKSVAGELACVRFDHGEPTSVAFSETGSWQLPLESQRGEQLGTHDELAFRAGFNYLIDLAAQRHLSWPYDLLVLNASEHLPREVQSNAIQLEERGLRPPDVFLLDRNTSDEQAAFRTSSNGFSSFDIPDGTVEGVVYSVPRELPDEKLGERIREASRVTISDGILWLHARREDFSNQVLAHIAAAGYEALSPTNVRLSPRRVVDPAVDLGLFNHVTEVLGTSSFIFAVKR